MAKKNFKGGFDSLLGNNKQENKIKTNTRSTPVKHPLNDPSTIKIRQDKEKIIEDNIKREEEVRATFIIDKNLLNNLKSIAYWDRLLIKDVLNQALNDYIDKYEIKNGEIKLMPKKK